ncbi:MAG TPA: translation initiation factor 2 [Micromonosporaceae bacterium]
MTQPQVPSPYSQQGSDEQLWRRPSASPADPRPAEPQAPPATPYSGPPPTTFAGPDWRPRTLIQVPAARQLPAQDDTALDEQEKAARTVSYGVGMVAGAIALIVLIVLCGRVVF